MDTVAKVLTALAQGQTSVGELARYAVVLDQATCDALALAQATLPADRPCKASPVPTANAGEWVLNADILTEVTAGRLYAGGFGLLGVDLSLVSVVPMGEVHWPVEEAYSA